MKNFKRFVGLLLCLAMVLSFVPASFVSVAKAATTTTDILEKIDISGTAVGGCSTNSASQSDYTKLSWWSDTHDTWGKHLKVVDNSLSSSCDFGADLGAGEFSDFYLDLTLKNGSAISADHLKLYYGADEDADMKTVTIILNLAGNAADVEQTFTTNWKGTTAGDPIEWDFGQTYEIDGIYVYSENGSDTRIDVSYAELELYQNVEVPYLETATLNGVDIGEYQIVYSASDLDYAKTAAEYIQEQILLKTGRQLDVVTDSASETTYEILVGETGRSYSESISAPSETAMKFTFASNGTKIAMKADYFIIAGAAYYFIETYVGDSDFEVTANTGVTTQNTITKPAKNYIFMIGDGMGEMHTRLFEIYDVPTSGEYAYSDGEDIFYGYYLPYLGWQKTANLYGEITDSAAAGTALATGYKTINGYVGKDQYLNDVKNLSELAMEYGKSVAIMSTEGSDGATPAAYSAHADGRYNDDEIKSDQTSFGGLLVDAYNNYNSYTADEFETWEALYQNALNSVSGDEDGFFIMYEEAHIDKVSHRLNYTSPEGETGDTDREVLFRTVYRFNQAIANFMEYALYNPDTMVLITADHETAGLDENFEPTEGNPIDEQVYGSVWNHSLADVPVFAYGVGADIFASSRDDAYENASIARTWADLMTDGNADDFGDPNYPLIGGGSASGTTLAALDSSHIVATDFGYYSDNDTDGELTSYYLDGYGPENLIDGSSSNQAHSDYYLYSEIADGTKIPAFVLELDEATVLGGMKFVGYQYGRYNMEDFEIQISTTEGTDTWVTVGSWDDAWVSGTNGNDTNPLTISFADSYTAYKVRVLISQITDMSAEANDDANSAELADGSYIRIKEVTLYYDTAATPGETPDPEEPTEEPTQEPTPAPTPAPTEEPTQAPINPGEPEQITISNAEVLIYNDSKNYTTYVEQADAAKLIDGSVDSYVQIGGNSASTEYAWSTSTHSGNGGKYTPTAILTWAEEKTLTSIELRYLRSDGGYQPIQLIVQAKVDGVWQNVATYDDDTKTGMLTLDLENVTTNQVRVLFTEIYQLSGLSAHCIVREISLYGTSVSGDIQLEAPDGLTITATKNTITATADAVTGGTLMFKLDNGEWQESGVFTGLEEGTTYTLYAKYVAEDGYIDSAETSVTVTTAKDIEIGGQITTEPIEDPVTPIVGYYSDNNTDGAITEHWIQKDGKGEAPSVLVDGFTGSSADYNWTGYYTHEEIASGAKIPVYFFEFDEPRAFTGITIDGYKAMYYGIEDFTVQVYIEGEGWVTATTVADSFSSQLQEEYAPAETHIFAEPLYGTKIRILVDKLWDMYDWRYDDDNSYELATGAYARLREITLLEDPDYVPPTNTQNVLKAPAYLQTTDITADSITVVAPPSTEYPEAVIQYTAYLNGVMVATNTTGVFTGLEHNTAYTFYAQYIGDGETWLNSHLAVNTTATDKDQLPPPTNVQATLGTTTITATADPVDGGTLVYRLMDENHIAIKEWQESGTFTGLTAGTQYTIQVKYNGDAQHYDSEITELTVVTGHILLEKPTLTVSGTTSNTITLNALAAVDGGSAEYAYSVDGVNWTTTTNPVITGLNASTTYYLRARYVATDDTHDSSLYSEIVTATTLTNELPAPVLTVTGTTDSSITVSANSNANGTLQFRVNGGAWQASGEFTGLNRNTEYTIEAMYVGINGYMDSDIASTTATTLKTQLHNPTGLTQTNATTDSITVTADTITGGTLMFRLAGGEWQTSGTFTGLTHGTTYTVEAMYVADEDYINSATNTIQAKTLTILSAPDLSATSTDTTITASAPAVTGGTLQYRISGREWQASPTFTGLKSNTTYTIEAMYVAQSGYVSSAIASVQVTTKLPADPGAGEYAYLEAIPESNITAHVGYNNYANHEMYAENTVNGQNICDAMYGTSAQIKGDGVTISREQLAAGRRLSVVYDLNAGATTIGAVELTGVKGYNITRFHIQVLNTAGHWQNVQFVTSNPFAENGGSGNETVRFTFTPATGTKVRVMIEDYEENANNAPEIREMVVYEVKEDALQEEKTASSTAAAVVDGNKTTVYEGTTATLTFGEPTSVKRLKLFGDTLETSVGSYTVKVQTTQGGAWNTVKTGTAYSGASGYSTCNIILDQEYIAYGVQIVADGEATIPEVEVYGYFEGVAPQDPTASTDPNATAPTKATKPAAVSPVQTSPVATEKFEIPSEPTWTETKPGDEGAWNDTKPGNESAWSDPTPVVPDETGTEPTAPTQATESSVVMGWLDAIPASEITAYSGDYDASLTTFTDRGDNEAGYLNNSAVNTGGYIGTSGKSSSKVQAAVFDLNGTKMIGAVELIGKYNVYLTSFDVQYKDGSGWHTAKSVTSNLFETDYMTVRITFDPVEATEVRILVYGWVNGAAENTGYPMLQEITWYEVKIGNALQQITVNSVTTDVTATSGKTGNTVDNIIDGDKGYYNGDYYYPLFRTDSTAGNFDFDVAQDEQPVSVSRMKIYATHDTGCNPSSIAVHIQTTEGGDWTQIYTGTAYASGFDDTFVLDFDQTYDVYAIRLEVRSSMSDDLRITEVEFYGPGEGDIEIDTSDSAESVGTTEVDTPDYEKIPLSKDDVVGICSDKDTGDTYINENGDFSNVIWYSVTKLQSGTVWRTLEEMFNEDYEDETHWGLDADERGDFLLDLSNDGNGTAIDRIKMYNAQYTGYTTASTITIMLMLKSGGTKTFEIETGWSSSTAFGEVCVYDLDQTYTVNSIYVWASSNNENTEIVFGEFELYAKQTVQLDAPKNLQATEIGENSITVAANTLNPAAAGTLKYQLKLGDSVVTAWTTDATFTNLTAGTTYTVEAMYDAADGYIDSGVSTITVTTATPIITEFTVSGTVTAGATVQLYKDRAVVSTVVATNGSYEFTNVNIGNYTLVVTKAGHTAQMMQIAVDKDLTVETITLVSAYNVSGTTTAGATVTLYQSGAVKQTATADGSGNYSFGSVALGNYTLVFTKTGYYTQTASVTVSEANVTVNKVTLTQTRISGTVTAGATVELYQNGAVQATATATNGSYSFDGMALGNYTLVFSLTGYHTKTEAVTLSTGNVTKNAELASARYTVSGTTTAGATVTLYQSGAVVDTTVADGSGNYSFSNVIIGNYAVTFTKAGYIAQGTTITVSGNLNVAAVALETVPVNSTEVYLDAVLAATYNIHLIEPWALRVNVTFYTEKNGTPIALNSLKSYGAFAIIANEYGDGVPTTWEDLLNSENVVQFKKAASAGDYNMYPTSDTTATFDFYEGLYTYRLAEHVYWVAYYEDDAGIHFTGSVMEPVITEKIDNIMGKSESNTEKVLLRSLKELHAALIAFRGEDADLGNTDYAEGVMNIGLDLGTTNANGYKFGKSHRIRLIEPWGLMVSFQVKPNSGAVYTDDDFEALVAAGGTYGMIFYHDKECAYNGDMRADQILARNDVYVYSQALGNVVVENGKMTAVYTESISTSILDSDFYCLPFVVDAQGNYHYSKNAFCMNLLDEMFAYNNKVGLKNEERETFRKMIELYESTLVHIYDKQYTK